jgi:hypothetical protein
MKHLKMYNSFRFRNEERKAMTVRDMRFELRMSGIKNIGDYSDIEVVRLYNKTFDNNTIGIDRDGEIINIILIDSDKYNL